MVYCLYEMRCTQRNNALIVISKHCSIVYTAHDTVIHVM